MDELTMKMLKVAINTDFIVTNILVSNVGFSDNRLNADSEI